MRQMQAQPPMQTQSPPGGISGWSQIGTRHYVAVTVLAVAIGLIATIQGTSGVSAANGANGSDQLAFFFPAAQQILNGHPFMIYAVRSLGYPNYNPPLGTVLIAPLLGIGQAFLPGASQCVASGYNDASCRSLLGFVGIAFIPFVILMGVAALAALRRVYPAMSQGQALTAYALIILSPLTWQNFTIWWHFEQPMMLFFFIAGVLQIQAKRPYLAGAFLGLALLSRTTAAVPLIALLVVLVAERSWGTLVRVAGIIALVAAVGFGPFFLFDYKDTSFSLLQWRGSAPIGNSIWSIFIGVPVLGKVAPRLDLYVAILVAAVIAWFAVQRFGVSSLQGNVYAVIAVASLLVPMLSKTNWPYYYAEPFVFIVIWEFATLQDAPAGLWRWPVLSVGFLSAAAILSQFMGLPSATGGGIVLRLMGVIQFLSMLAFAYAIWQRFSDMRQPALEQVQPHPNPSPF